MIHKRFEACVQVRDNRLTHSENTLEGMVSPTTKKNIMQEYILVGDLRLRTTAYMWCINETNKSGVENEIETNKIKQSKTKY